MERDQGNSNKSSLDAAAACVVLTAFVCPLRISPLCHRKLVVGLAICNYWISIFQMLNIYQTIQRLSKITAFSTRTSQKDDGRGSKKIPEGMSLHGCILRPVLSIILGRSLRFCKECQIDTVC